MIPNWNFFVWSPMPVRLVNQTVSPYKVLELVIMTPAKRPLGVWLILAFYVLGMGFICFEVLSFASYFPQLEVLALNAIFAGALNLIGAVLLFRLRKAAVLFFAVSFVYSTAASIPGVLRSNWKAIDPANLGERAIGILVALAILFYAMRLRQRGILR
jgi:hypothetical protein